MDYFTKGFMATAGVLVALLCAGILCHPAFWRGFFGEFIPMLWVGIPVVVVCVIIRLVMWWRS